MRPFGNLPCGDLCSFRAVCCVIAMLLLCVAGGCETTAIDATPGPSAQPQPQTQPALLGQLIDMDGQPVEGVAVYASANGGGKASWRLQQDEPVDVLTDEQGRFRIPVPFDGVSYHLLTDSGLVSLPQHFSVPGLLPGQPRVIQVRRLAGNFSVSGNVLDDQGQPVAGATVQFSQSPHNRRVTQSNAQGRYQFDGLPERYGRACLLGQHGGLWGIATLPRTAIVTMDIKLAAPGSVAGRLRDASTGEPLAQGKVILTSHLSAQLRREVEVDADGRFLVEGLPPGDYSYHAVTPTHVDLPDRRAMSTPRAVFVSTGVTSKADRFNLQLGAVITGTVRGVNGEPVGGASVAMEHDVTGMRYTITDANGHYRLVSGNVGSRVDIHVFSPTQGYAFAMVKDIQPGSLHTKDITLHGTASVRGTVRDASSGLPVEGVAVVVLQPNRIRTTTDADGRFDFGLVPLEAERKRVRVSAVPDRPGRIPSIWEMYYGIRNYMPQEPNIDLEHYYANGGASEVAEHGSTFDFDVQLQRVDLLKLTCRLVDGEGKPITSFVATIEPPPHTSAGVKKRDVSPHVLLYRGNETPENWAEYYTPNKVDIRTSNIVPIPTPMPILSGQVDGDGRFIFHFLRTDGLASTADLREGPVRFSIGTIVGQNESHHIKDVQFDRGETEVDLEIVFRPDKPPEVKRVSNAGAGAPAAIQSPGTTVRDVCLADQLRVTHGSAAGFGLSAATNLWRAWLSCRAGASGA